MSLILTKNLDSDLAAFSACILEGTSTRAPVSPSTELLTEFEISNYADYSGNLRVYGTVGLSTSIRQSDTVIISGATGDMSIYNGIHKVLFYDFESVTLTTLWQGGVANTDGVLTRVNPGMRIRADVYNGSTFINSVYAQPIYNTWTLDISPILQTQFSSIFTLTEGAQNTSGAVFVYNVKLFEQWLDNNYEIIEEETINLVTGGLAHKTVNLTDLISGTKLPYTTHQSSTKIFHHFYTDKTSGVKISFIPYIKLIAQTPTTVDINVVNKHGFAVYNIPQGSTSVKVKTIWFNGSEDVSIKEDLIVNVPQVKTADRIYFENTLGGFQTIEFISYENTTVTNKISKYCVEAWVQKELMSITENKDSADYFKDLPNSSEIYDSSGNLVYLITPKVRYYGNNVSALVTLKYNKNIIN